MIYRALTAVVVAVVVSGCGADEPAGVELGTVQASTVAEVVEAPATVAAKASASLTSPANGTVADLLVSDGERVAAGDKLLRIDAPDAQRRLREALAADRAAARPVAANPPTDDLAARQRQLDAAAEQSFRTAREAAEALPVAGGREAALAAVRTSEAAYRAARAAAADAVRGVTDGVEGLQDAVASLTEAQRVQTRAAVSAARRTVDALTVTAPFAGTVSFGGGSSAAPDRAGDLLAQVPEELRGQAEQALGGGGGDSVSGSLAVGMPVSTGAALLTVTDVSELSLVAEVDETDVLLVRPGIAAEAELDAVPGATYAARVTSVDVAAAGGGGEGASVTYPVRLSLGRGTQEDEAAPTPRPGMSAVVDLRVRTVDGAVSVPSSAVFRDGPRDAVWVADSDRARKRPVRLGAQGTDVVQVLEGVKLGERIVVRGADKVREDQQLPLLQ